MPLVRIALRKGKTGDYRRAIGDAVHRSMVEAFKVPADDRFQIITEHDADGLIYDANYLGIKRSDDVIFIQVTFSTGRTLEQKRRFYREVTEALTANPGVRPQDVFINLVEVGWENWSFGEGVAQYALEATA